MKLTLAIKLAPSRAQHAALVATLERFNAACNAIAEVAFREQLANKIALQKIVYYAVRERFEPRGAHPRGLLPSETGR